MSKIALTTKMKLMLLLTEMQAHVMMQPEEGIEEMFAGEDGNGCAVRIDIGQTAQKVMFAKMWPPHEKESEYHVAMQPTDAFDDDETEARDEVDTLFSNLGNYPVAAQDQPDVEESDMSQLVKTIEAGGFTVCTLETLGMA